MAWLTVDPIVLDPIGSSDIKPSRQGQLSSLSPEIDSPAGTVHVSSRNLLDYSATLSSSATPTVRAPNARARMVLDVRASSVPIQIWEGTVLSIDHEKQVMEVLLVSKTSPMPRHTAEIELQWVTDQDADLVRDGAVFYLTLYKRTKPSVENAQELRFRRRPSWSASQIQKVNTAAARLLAKLRPLKQA